MTCGQCGNIGHNKENCWENPKNKRSKETKNSKFYKKKENESRFCIYCKMKGHTEPYCIKKRKMIKRKLKDKRNEGMLVLMAYGGLEQPKNQ